MVSSKELFRRLTVVQTAARVKNTAIADNIRSAKKALEDLKPEDIELLRQVSPEIDRIVGFSVEDLLLNRNGEREAVSRFYALASTYAENLLHEYEEKLC